MSVKLIYKDIAPGAKEDIKQIDVSEINENIADKQYLITEEKIEKKLATVELNQWKLSGEFKGIRGKEIAYWSTQVSNDTINNNVYEFATPITLTRVFNKKHASVGITIQFDTPDYSPLINIKWYNDDTIVADENFMPDNSNYFCSQPVDLFNKVTITFAGMNKPNRFLKIWVIDDGVSRTFTNRDLTDVSVLEEMSLISNELPINTLTLGIRNNTDAEFIFQKKQPLYLYQDESIVGMYFVNDSKREGEKIYNLKAQDYLGILNDNVFLGNIYFNELAGNIINEIFENEAIKVNIDDETFNTKLTGYIPKGSKRDALAQVLFATCSVCDTSRSNSFNIFKLNNTYTDLSKDNTFIGGTIKTDKIVTSVSIASHNYTPENQRKELFKGILSVGDNLISFKDPIDLSKETTTNKGSFKVLKSTYCIVTLSEQDIDTDTVIIGYPYVDNVSTKTITNPNILSGATKTEYSIKDATLVSQSNVDTVLTNVFNYYLRNSALECDIVINDEKVGSGVNMHTMWQGDTKGFIEKLEYGLRSKKIGKVVQRLDG